MRPACRSAALLAALALAVAGCGGSDEAPTTKAPASGGAAQRFPTPDGRGLDQLRRGLPQGPILAPSVSVLDPGRQRIGFALFDRARRMLEGSQAALYVQPLQGGPASGPFWARSESLVVPARFRSRTNAADPNSAKSVYVADVDFKRAGDYGMLALVRLDGRLVSSSPLGVRVGGRRREPPDVGDMAIRVHTPTVADARGDLSRIDTRVPPAPQLHRDDLAQVLGKKPVILLFATPQLCQSRVCGPVVDIAADIEARYGNRLAVIHNEVYRDNQIERGLRPQMVAWHLLSEPWLFAIDRSGRIVERIEGAFSTQELDRAARRAIAG